MRRNDHFANKLTNKPWIQTIFRIGLISIFLFSLFEKQPPETVNANTDKIKPTVNTTITPIPPTETPIIPTPSQLPTIDPTPPQEESSLDTSSDQSTSSLLAPLLYADREGAIPGQYIVVYKNEVSVSEAGVNEFASIQEYGGKVDSIYDIAFQGYSAFLTPQALQSVRQNPLVDYVAADFYMSSDIDEINTNSIQKGAAWGLDRIDQQSLPLSTTYSYSNTASNVNVYVLDSGVLTSHVEFVTRRATNDVNFVPDGHTTDCYGHGTHIAATIGGISYGVAKGVKIHAVRISNCVGTSTYSQMISGINWVISHHVHPAVVNMSVGSTAAGIYLPLETAVKKLIAAGVPVVVASGNANANACSYEPASIPGVITVGATTSTDARASTSNRGTCVDLFAPGTNIKSAWFTGSKNYALASGTSMASAHVTGVVAIYLTTHPSASVSTVTSALINNATTGKVTNAGTGSPNRLLFSLWAPKIPTSVIASNGTYADKILIKWAASSGADSYKVYRAISTTGSKTFLGKTTSFSFTHTTAQSGVRYYYWITACISSVCSGYSSSATGLQKPIIPINVKASQGTNSDKVSITWNTSLDATSYKVYRSTSETGTKTLLVNTTSLNHTDTNAKSGVRYLYWVTACKSTNCTPYSTYARGWRLPDAPINVTASQGTYSDKVIVQWSVSSGANSYAVYRSFSESEAKEVLDTVSSTSYSDTSANLGVNYFYWVTACNGTNCTAYSDFAIGYENPFPPTNVQASDGLYSDKVLVTWNSMAGASSYKVYRAPSETGESSLVGTSEISEFSDTTGASGVTYYYWVAACADDTLCTEFSTDSDSGWHTPVAPANIQASDGTYSEKVMITWGAMDGASSYKIFRSTSADISFATELGSSNPNSYEDTTARSGVIYYYWVNACNSNLNCTGLSVDYDSGWHTPQAPTNVQASDGTYSDKIAVMWDAMIGASSYNIYRSTSDSSSASLLTGNTSTNSFEDTSSAPSVTYYYWVTACNAVSNCTSLSESSDSGWQTPLSPTNVQASDGTYSDKVFITWDGMEGATAYRIYRATSATGTASLIGPSTTNEYADSTAQKGFTYYYWVTACNSSGKWTSLSMAAYDSGWRATE